MNNDVDDPMDIPPVESPDDSSIDKEPPPVTSYDEDSPSSSEDPSGEDSASKKELEEYQGRITRLLEALEELESKQPGTLFEQCVEHLPEILNAKLASIYTYDPDNNILTLQNHNHSSDINQKIWVTEENNSIMELVISKQEILILEDIEEFSEEHEFELTSTFVDKYETSSCISMPLMAGDELLGIFNIADPEEGDQFLPDHYSPLARMIKQHLGLMLKTFRLQKEAKEFERVDSLTGILNYQSFQKELQKEVLRSKRYHRPLSLVIMDFKELSKINEEYGYDAGDYFLQLSAEKLSENMRTVDTLARYGGDEFVVIMPEIPYEKAEKAAERWVRLLNQSKFEWEGNTLSRNVQFGISELDKDQTIPEFLKETEQDAK